MQKAIGTNTEMEEVLEALSGYLEAMEHIEVLYSPKRGYLLLRWDTERMIYYGIDSVNDQDELALYIYGELVERITVETKSDHNLKDMDFDALEMEEAKAVTRKFLNVLPEQVRERVSGKLDPVTGLIPNAGCNVKNLLG